ncbi:hypothetical protein GCM10012275_39430 [Longimycelium tulufanense]|uniref:IrrE N-terminal-like domain-containing protein n=1 Tax=Longimycelium tulufanense TaxID=907463 RepID=A0A8J3FXR6_9PSEU|nr:ImmA/IrrE family metallo-endopeptidase [Longimycelium tulufanense]GGM65011.1 hypothetical protein GCM10012275_39430 [Longimycelium tulufanense]
MDWGTGYDPCEHAEALGAEIVWSRKVEGLGDYRGGVIRLHPDLTQAEQRCTLAHEIVHHENRDDILGYCGIGWLDNRIEHRVHTIAARRLITVPELAEAARWSDHPIEVAEALVVDTRTLYTWLLDMTPAEYRDIRERARGRVRASLNDIRRYAARHLPRQRAG